MNCSDYLRYIRLHIILLVGLVVAALLISPMGNAIIVSAQLSQPTSSGNISSSGGTTKSTGNISAVSNITSSHTSPLTALSGKPKTVNLSELARNQPLTARSNATPPVDVEGQKSSRTNIIEKQTELLKENSKQTLLQLRQLNRTASMAPSVTFGVSKSMPGTAGQVLLNLTNIPQLNLKIAKSNSTSTSNTTDKGNTSRMIGNSSLDSQTSAQNPPTEQASYNPFAGIGMNIIKKVSSTIQPRPTTSSVGIAFDGINEATGGAIPPDVTVAAGPNHVVETVNNGLSIFSKTGAPLSTVRLNPFFLVANDHRLSDPEVMFDALSGRWFISILDFGQFGNPICVSSGNPNSCFVFVAVSQTNDPTGQWWIYSFGWGSVLPDQPRIAANDDKLLIGVNDFNTGLPPAAELLVVDKTALISGSGPSIQFSGPQPSEFSMLPVKSLSSTSCVFVVSVGHFGTSQLRLSQVCGNPATGGSTFNINMALIPMAASITPPQGAQLGSTVPIDTADGRMSTAAYYNGKIWDGFNDGCVPNGTSNAQACVRIQELNVFNLAAGLLIDTNIAMQLTDNYYPALSIDNTAHMRFVLGFSNSATSFPSLLAGDDTFTFALLRSGSTSIDDGGFGPNPRPRYGDYFGAAVDPSGNSIWGVGEYGNNILPHTWSTFIGNW
jgi:hypothetical protein